MPVATNLSAVTVLVTVKLFSTVRSLLTVTAGVTVIPLESEESNTLDVNVKLPSVAGCTALSANVPCADVAASVIPYPANVVGVPVILPKAKSCATPVIVILPSASLAVVIAVPPSIPTFSPSLISLTALSSALIPILVNDDAPPPPPPPVPSRIATHAPFSYTWNTLSVELYNNIPFAAVSALRSVVVNDPV